MTAQTFSVSAAPISLEERYVPFSVADGSAGQDLKTSFSLNARNAARSYGFFAKASETLTVELNGRTLDVDPLVRNDGVVFLIDPMYLRAGTNDLRVRRGENDPNASWDGTAFFSLDGTYELAHFVEVFRDEEAKAAAKMLKDIAPDSRQEHYDVLWYDCTWKPNMFDDELLAGSMVTMRAKSTVSGLTQVVLDFDRNPEFNSGGTMSIDFVDAGPATSALSYSLDTPNNLLIITLASPVNTGEEFQVRVGYHGTPNDEFFKQIFGSSPYNRRTHGTSFRPTVYTASQPYGGRRWWPCKDFPGDKATTSVQRIIVPTTLGYDLTAVSNGKLKEVTDNGDGTETWVWENSYPISTYLISMAVSDYLYAGTEYTSRDGQTTMPIGHFIYPENAGIEGNGHLGTLQVLNFFADTFGEYPFLSEKYATATWRISFGIEHQTCTGMPAGTSGGVGNGQTDRNIHELAHQWYGDKITCHTWDHAWLNEGFATYCVALWKEYSSGKNSYHGEVNSWSPTSTVPVVNPNADDFAGSVIYNKGGWILHMLRRVVGDEAFFQALRDHAALGYTTTLSQADGTYPNVTARFQSTVESAAGLATGALDPFFDQWLHRPNGDGAATPTYAFTGNLTESNGSYSLNLTINQQQSGPVPFTMPVEFRVQDAQGASHIEVVQNSSFSQSVTIPLGTTLPLEIDFDPENWMINNLGLSINTVGLSSARLGQPYSAGLRASGGSNYNWSSSGALPPGMSLSSSGILSGTPTQSGSWQFSVTVSTGSGSRTTSLRLDVTESAPLTPLVINEIYYDPAGTDTREYIELKNRSSSPVDIGGCRVVLVNGGNGTAYGPSPIVIPDGTILAGNDYFVIGNAATVGTAVDLDVSLDDVIQNGAPDAVVLRDAENFLLDALAYEADSAFGGSGTDRSAAVSEGGTGGIFSTTWGSPDNMSLGRLPDGEDTGSNLLDFSPMPPSPGAANAGSLVLPFADSFDSAPSPAWHKGFVAVRSVDGGGTKPPASPAGGKMLEVVDSSGGGDVAFLSGGHERLSFEGWIWLPVVVGSNGWSVGVGIATRTESAWFSTTDGYAVENGFYLEYQNGPLGSGGPLKGGAIPNVTTPGTVRLLAVDGTPSLFNDPEDTAVAVLGSTTDVTPGGWNRFRLVYDGLLNRLAASVGNSGAPFYEGAIPGGGYNRSGGVVVGFRENHTGGPGGSEATWVDDVIIGSETGYTPAKDWSLYD